MNYKFILSIAAVAIGFLLVVNGFYSKYHISSAHKEIEKMANSKNPILRAIGEEIDTTFGSHHSRVFWSFISGIGLVVIGGGGIYYFRIRKG